MAAPAPTTRQSKRQRAIVDYKEPYDDDLDNLLMSDSDYERSAAKKQKRAKKVARAAQASTTQPQPEPEPEPEKVFPLLDLPAEIRNQVYDYVLYDPDGIGLTTKTRNYRQVVRRSTKIIWSRYPFREKKFPYFSSLVPNLTMLNRQVRREASGYLYRSHFQVSDSKTLFTFLGMIGQSNVACLRRLTVYVWGPNAMDYAAMTALAPATALEMLTIRSLPVWGRDYEDCAKMEAMKVWRQSRNFIQAYSTAAGRKDAALDVIDVGTSLAHRAMNLPAHQLKAMVKDMEGIYLDEMRRLIGV